MRKTRQLQVSIPEELYEKAKKIAEADGRSMSNYVAQLIRKDAESVIVEHPHKKKDSK